MDRKILIGSLSVLFVLLLEVIVYTSYLSVILLSQNNKRQQQAINNLVPALNEELGFMETNPNVQQGGGSENNSAAQVKFGEYAAFSALRGDKIYLILQKGEKEIVIDQGDAKLNEDMSNIDEAKNFSKLEFSPNGHYLLYSREGYEWVGSYVYNVTTSENVLESDGVSMKEDRFSFTPDERYFYTCSSNEFMGSITGEVYSVPSFKLVFDASKGNDNYYLGEECNYDQKTNAIIFTLDNPTQRIDSPLRTKIVRYNLNGIIPNVKIISPAKGDKWVVGRSYELKWVPVSPKDPIDIKLFDNSAESAATRLVWQSSSMGDIPNTGSYVFNVFEWINPGDDYQFEITEYEGNNTSYTANSEEFSMTVK